MVEYHFANFESCFPSLAKKALVWYMDDYGDLIVTLDDGEIISFDTFTDTYRKFIEDIRNASEEDYRREFGIRLRRLMAFNNINREILSERTDISLMAIGRYIRGQSLPTIRTLTKIADAIGCDISELIL